MIKNVKVFESRKIAEKRFLETKKVTEEEFEKIVTYVPHERYFKYLPWIFDVWCKTDKKLDPDEIMSIVQWFDTNLPRIQKKDIYQYSFQDMLNLEKELGTSKSAEQKQSKELDSENVYEDNQIKILRIKTYKAANMYNGEGSSGRSWCVGRQESTWDSYTEHSTFYYAWYKPQNASLNNFERSAIQVQGNKITVWDRNDHSHSLEKTPFKHLEKTFKFIPPDLRDRLLKNAHTVLPDGTYHFKTQLRLDGKGLKSLRELPIRISRVDGEFNVSNNELVDLRGCPQNIKSLIVSKNHLKSLEGCPPSIAEDFNISDNPLTSLKGCAENIGGNFTASNTKITSLVGGPKKVKGDYTVNNCELKTTMGIAEEVGKNINLDENKLEYLDVENPELRKKCSVKKNPLKSYEGFMPEQFVKGGRLQYKDTPDGIVIQSMMTFSEDYIFDSLDKLPFKFYKSEKEFQFNRRKNMGITVPHLKGSPEIVEKTFEVSSNNLQSLEGAPRIIGGKFMASFNDFDTLKGFPESVGINVVINRIPRLKSLEHIGQIGEHANGLGTLFLLNTPAYDLSPLAKNKYPLRVVVNDDDVDKYFNVPKNVRVMTSDQVEKEK